MAQGADASPFAESTQTAKLPRFLNKTDLIFRPTAQLGFFLPVAQNAFMTLIGKLFGLGLRNAMRRRGVVLVVFLSLTNFHCRTGAIANLSGENTAEKRSVPKDGYEVVNTWPHDAKAYTQGLVFHDGKLLESTGQEGKSSLRNVEPETGKILKKVDIPRPYFAEGITLFKGKIYQLTWQHQRGFIYDAGSFKKLGEFSYESEGWGLTNDGKFLILSDGTSRIRFLDPDNFQVTRTIAVIDRPNSPVAGINELEYVQGEIYANIWHDERIARIDPQTGRVTGWIDLTGLRARTQVTEEEAVLNGIAYDETSNRLFVTGKLWPKLYEIRVKHP